AVIRTRPTPARQDAPFRVRDRSERGGDAYFVRTCTDARTKLEGFFNILSVTDHEDVQCRVGENPRPRDNIQPSKTTIPRSPLMHKRKQKAALRKQGKRTVEIRRNQSALTRDGRYGCQSIAAKSSDLEPSGSRIGTQPDHDNERPCQTHDHDQQ